MITFEASNRDPPSQAETGRANIYIYIYTHVCVCAFVCACVYISIHIQVGENTNHTISAGKETRPLYQAQHERCTTNIYY